MTDLISESLRCFDGMRIRIRYSDSCVTAWSATLNRNVGLRREIRSDADPIAPKYLAVSKWPGLIR